MDKLRAGHAVYKTTDHEQNSRGFMAEHTHEFVENYSGFVGFGFNRETDEHTIVYYLQKISDDTLAKTLIGRLTDDELTQLFELMTRLMKKHLTEPEYHRLFLKDKHHG